MLLVGWFVERKNAWNMQKPSRLWQGSSPFELET